MSALDVHVLALVMVWLGMMALVLRFAEWEKRMNQDRLAFSLAITGKASSLKHANQIVRKFWDYNYHA